MRIAVNVPGTPESTELHVQMALQGLGVETLAFQFPKLFWMRSLKKFQPDWIIFSSQNAGYHLVQKNTLTILRNTLRKSKIAFWTFDSMRFVQNEKWFIPLGKSVDVVCMKERCEFSRYHSYGINIHYLDQGAIPGTTFGNIFDKRFESDVAFVGDLHNEETVREQRLALLTSLSNKFDLKIWSRNIAAWRNTPLEKIVRGEIWERDWPTLAASVKVLVGIDSKQDCEGCWSSRVYKALGSGCFFLNHYVPGFEKVFTRGKHLDWYSTTEEAIDKTRMYLNEPDKREAIRLEGYRYVHSNCTYQHRTQELLEILKLVPLRTN